MSVLDLYRGEKPDITPNQVKATIIATIPVLANVLRAFGVYDMTEEQQDALKQAADLGVIFAGVLVLADAHLRAARGKAAATVKAAALLPAPSTPPSEPAGAPQDTTPEVVEEFPTDDEEFAAPPGAMPVQPSETGQTGQS